MTTRALPMKVPAPVCRPGSASMKWVRGTASRTRR